MRSPATPEVPVAWGFFKITLDHDKGFYVSSWDIRAGRRGKQPRRRNKEEFPCRLPRSRAGILQQQSLQ
jgi:hypothetical protein